MTKPEIDFEGVEFGDKRLSKRLKASIENFRKSAGKSILSSGESRSSAKGFYRLLSNEKFECEKLEEAEKTATKARLSNIGGHVLFIQDTSDIDLNGHKKTKGLGYCSEHIRGIKLHSCIATSIEGVPLGLMGQYYETRKEAKSTLTKAEKAARPIEEKESYRWLEMLKNSTKDLPENVTAITICDREGDFYELYAKALELKQKFIIRVRRNRNGADNEKIVKKLRNKTTSTEVIINIPRDTRRGVSARTAKMEVTYITVDLPKSASVNDATLPAMLTINIVRIAEINTPDGEEPIEWILATNLTLNDNNEAMTIVEYYVIRWRIERFHFVLKSGLNAEKIQQRTYEKIKPVLLIYSVIALYIMAITYLGKTTPEMSCDLVFDDDEWKILYRVANKTKVPPDSPYTIAEALQYLGQIGSFKRSPSGGYPGVKAIWLGLNSLYHTMDLLVGQV